MNTMFFSLGPAVVRQYSYSVDKNPLFGESSHQTSGEQSCRKDSCLTKSITREPKHSTPRHSSLAG